MYAVIAAGFVGLLLLAYAALIEPRRLEIHTVHVRVPSMPPFAGTLRIAQLSDLHGRYQVKTQALDRWVAELSPDLVAVTGDLLDPNDDPRPLLAMLRRLAARWPVYYVTGNHEHLLDLEWARARARGPHSAGQCYHSLGAFLKDVSAQGVRVLENSHQVLAFARGSEAARLTIAGVSDPSRNHDQALVPGTGPWPRPIVLLAHSPDIVIQAEERGVDLVIAGHTHGGQVCVPGIGALVTRTRVGRRFASGLHQVGGTQLYVSRGIGMTTLPIRFACPPELAVLELEKE